MHASDFTRNVPIAILVLVALYEPVAGQQGREREQVTWVQGVVRDESGRPVKDAEVFACATYHGGLRMYEMVRKARTDDAGNYAVSGNANLSSFSAILLGRVPGRPPALAWFRLPEPPDRFGAPSDERTPPPPKVDLVVPAHGGTLEVRVSERGQPAANVAVVIRPQGINLRDMWARDDGAPERKEVVEFYEPLKRTAEDGVARFEGLLPGNYVILASADNDDAVRSLREHGRSPFIPVKALGTAYGIPVRVGETTSHYMAVYEQPNQLTFKLIRHDDKPFAVRPEDGTSHITWGSVHSSSASTTGIKLDQNGVGQFMFDRTGLTTVSFPYKETTIHSSPISLPFWSAHGIVAVSPRLANSFHVALQGAEHRGGAVFLRLVDAEGRLLEGYGAVYSKTGQASHHSSDIPRDGHRFEGLRPGTYVVRARANGVPWIALHDFSGPLPTDQALAASNEFLPQKVSVEDNEELEVTLRVEQVGYVRGKVNAPEGRKASDYYVTLDGPDGQSGAGIAYRREIGEFVAGPFRQGTVALSVHALDRSSAAAPASSTVAIEAGRVAHTAITAPDVPKEGTPARDSVLIGMTGISRQRGGDGPNGLVQMSGAKSPALAAIALAFDPAVFQPVGAGITDAKGLIRPRAFWLSGGGDERESRSPDEKPFVISWLPGHCGAAIIPLPETVNQPLSIVLPPPVHLRGRVTVAGDGETVDNGTLTVRAQHEGNGKLGDLMSIETSASADGKFELAGLTPGKYRVQAALDGIWLSPSVEFVAGEKALEPVTLTIAEPGGPVLVKLTGQRQRQPEKLTVNRPEGPLRERLWPKFLTPDGAGVVRIPALEAGKHLVRVGNVEKEVTVLPLEESKGRPVEIELDLGE